MRADIVTARAAVAHAAWHDRTDVTRADIRAAARLALPHRRRRNPFDAPGLDEDLLDRLLGDDDLEPEPEPTSRRPGAGADPTPERERAAVDAARGAARSATEPRGATARPGRRLRIDRRPTLTSPSQPAPVSVAQAGAAVPGPAVDRPRHRRRRGRPTQPGPDQRRSDRRRRPDRRQPAALPGDRPGGRDRAAAPRPASPATGCGSRRGDLRTAVTEGRESNLVLFCVDASGSMAARKRMAEVKTAVLSLLLDAYQRRDKVGLVTFRGSRRDAGAAAHLVGRGGGPAAGGGAERWPYAAGRGTAVRGGHAAVGADPRSAPAAAAGRGHRRPGHRRGRRAGPLPAGGRLR